MKSIAYVLPATVVGGAETKFFNIMRHMSGVRHVLLTHRHVAPYFSELGIRVYLFEEYGCEDPLPVSVRRIARYARAISSVARKEAADCIVGIMHTGSFYGAAARDLYRLKAPLIGTIEGVISAFFDREGRAPSLLEGLLLRYLLKRPRLIVVPSAGVKADLAGNFGVDEEKITVIYNGVDIAHIRSSAEHAGQGEEAYSGKTIVTACRLSPEKDFLTLLRAFRLVRQKMKARLVIVGEGELREEITGNARRLGVGEDVVITGFQKNPFGFIKRADVFVLSSFFEGFGNVIVEAMALGVPVVATRCPTGPGEIIRSGHDGLLVPVGDDSAMSEAILRLLTDSAARDKLTVQGRLRAEGFTVETMAGSFRKLITECC